jgi:hypothetical protein
MLIFWPAVRPSSGSFLNACTDVHSVTDGSLCSNAETLVYFQDQLSEMLSLIESSPPEVATPELTLHSSDTVSNSPSVASTLPIFPDSMHDQAQPAEAMPVEISSQDAPMPMTLGEVVLYSAGAIFALILTFFMRKSRSPIALVFVLIILSSIRRPILSCYLKPLFHHYGLDGACGWKLAEVVTA